MESFSSVFREIQGRIAEKGLGSLKGIYRFEIGSEVYRLAPKEGGGHTLGKDPGGPVDCTICMSPSDFVYLIRSPNHVVNMFLQGQIQITNTPKALELGWALQKLAR